MVFLMKKILLNTASFTAIVLLLMLEAFNKPAITISKPVRRIAVFCAPSFNKEKLNEKGAPLFTGLGHLHYTITTRSARAQKYFNQGLTLVYAFNHSEAGRSFKEMIRLDSTCAMAYWGMGMVLGPNYNAPLNPTSLAEINEVMDKAVRYAAAATPKEKALVYALAKRFPRTEVPDMTPYNNAYAMAMKEAYASFPGDAEIATLYADALMNEHPWDLWEKAGAAKSWTPAIEQLLEKILAQFPDHIGANHMYLHAIEASGVASKALPSADKLRDMLPAAGHIVHMPSHIYIRTGNYHKGVIANIKASEADSTYIAQCKIQGSYPLLLYPHNIHFLAVCAFLEGNSKQAIDASWMVARKSDQKFIHEVPTVQHYYSIPYYTLVHLGKWNDILKLPPPDASLQYPRSIWHFARGMAFAANGNKAEAEKELKTLQQYAADSSLQAKRIWDMNSVWELINIAAFSLEAEIAMHDQQFDRSVELLKKAVAIEDNLVYQEPPDWYFSVRHLLGHVLNQAKRFSEAEKIYREDLVTFPENGWALMGLYNSLKGQDKAAEAAVIKKRFDTAWHWADITIRSSRVF
jgi:tetratricopeptide (TPR) repeat protein